MLNTMETVEVVPDIYLVPCKDCFYPNNAALNFCRNCNAPTENYYTGEF